MNWSSGGGQPGGGGQPPHLSVVTTVWGQTQTTQSPPFNQGPNPAGFTNTTMSTTPYTQQPPGFNGPPHKPNYQGATSPTMSNYNRLASNANYG